MGPPWNRSREGIVINTGNPATLGKLTAAATQVRLFLEKGTLGLVKRAKRLAVDWIDSEGRLGGR